MKTIFAALAIAFVACSPTPQSDMERWARSALKCQNGTLAWSMVEPDCGTVDQAGNYTAPATCPVPYTDRFCHVQVSGCGNTAQVPVQVVDNNVQALTIYCGVVAPETCCRQPPWTVEPGTAIQMYAMFQYSCAGHVAWSSPNPPPPLCP